MEDAIADIATVFHWPPDAYHEMTFGELITWREKARVRAETEEQTD